MLRDLGCVHYLAKGDECTTRLPELARRARAGVGRQGLVFPEAPGGV